jgi:thiol-disulfide isomerase/thioredoxin
MDPPTKPVSYIYMAVLALITCAATLSSFGEDVSYKTVSMYFFWQTGCSHCEELKPFLDGLEEQYPQLDLKRVEASKSQEGSDLFDVMAKAYGRKAKVTPTVFIGEYMIEGYNGWITEGRIESALINCTEKKCPTPEQKILEYRKLQATTTTVSTTTSTTTTTSTASTAASTTTSSTTTTSASSSTSTTTLPPTEEKADTPLIPGALVALFLILALAAVRSRRDKGAGADLTG